MAIPNSLDRSGLPNLSQLNRRFTSTPVCLPIHDSGYLSSLGSLPYTPFRNLGLKTIEDTPDDQPLRFQRSDSLAQALFHEEDDFHKSVTSDYDLSGSHMTSASNKLEEYEHDKQDLEEEEMVHESMDSGFLKSDDHLVDYWRQKDSLRQRNTPKDYTYTPYPGQEIGETHVDFLRELGHYRSCLDVVSHVFSYLTPQDLTSAGQVSHTWCKLVQEDRPANKRRSDFLETRRLQGIYGKENGRLSKLRTQQACAIGQWRASLANIGNLVHTPVSPVKRERETKSAEPSIGSRIALFQEQAKKLLPCEHLQPCPRCQSPSRVTPQERRARCTFSCCAFDYCTQCRENYHSQTPCRKSALVGSILRQPQRRNVIGGKTARRNLKRL